MSIRTILVFAGLLPLAVAAQQGRLAPAPPQGQPPQNQPPPGKGKLAEPPRGSISERCANFRREIRHVRRQEAEATTIGAKDQFAARRQQLEAQRSKAGC